MLNSFNSSNFEICSISISQEVISDCFIAISSRGYYSLVMHNLLNLIDLVDRYCCFLIVEYCLLFIMKYLCFLVKLVIK